MVKSAKIIIMNCINSIKCDAILVRMFVCFFDYVGIRYAKDVPSQPSVVDVRA